MLVSHGKIRRDLKCILSEKKLAWKGYILTSQNYSDSKKIRDWQVFGKRDDEKAEQRGFLGQWKYLVWYYDSGGICHYMFVQTIENIMSVVNVNIN